MSYSNFENFVLRTPLLPIDYFFDFTNAETVTDTQCRNAFDNPVIRESLYLASPELYSEILKWFDGNLRAGDAEKIKYSFIKYITRACSRSTPFGLFAGCSLGKFIDGNTNIVLDSLAKNQKTSRFDMDFLVNLSTKIAALPFVRAQLKLFPNNTIYHVGASYRYVEYFYTNGIRNHQIVSVDKSKHLDKILKSAKKGRDIAVLSKLLISDSIDYEMAEDYVNHLIDNQILVSELEPSITGPDYLERLISILSGINDSEIIVGQLSSVRQTLAQLDVTLGNDPASYRKIIESLKLMDVPFKEKHLFQTDMSISNQVNSLDKTTIAEIKKGIKVLSYLSGEGRNQNLEDFKNRFLERYDEKEVPLAKVMDTEIGIGFGQNDNHGDVNPLVDDLPVNAGGNSPGRLVNSNFHPVFHKKILQANLNSDYVIKISDSDFEGTLPFDIQMLPETMSSMVQLTQIDGIRKIKFDTIGGASGANLLARFCYANPEIGAHARRIVDFEKHYSSEKIVAEIVHLPESRLGNVLIRPHFRQYEIPYLGNSTLDDKFQINIDDLYVSVKRNRIILKSKKHNREVLPRLTNAHNFHNSSLPIYRFLCSLQNSERSHFMSFELGGIETQYPFIPRIEYENLILQEATWHVQSGDLKEMYSKLNDDTAFSAAIANFQDTLRIPNLFYLVSGDNKLLVNLKNSTSAKIFLNEVKNAPLVKITEFLFSEQGYIKNELGQRYTNELIITFHKTNEQKAT